MGQGQCQNCDLVREEGGKKVKRSRREGEKGRGGRRRMEGEEEAVGNTSEMDGLVVGCRR